MGRQHDILQPKPKAKPTLAFNVREGRLPVLRHDKVMVGHVGPLATEATLGKFGLKRGGLIQTVKGRQCWVGNKPLAVVSAEGTNPNAELPPSPPPPSKLKGQS